MCRSIVPLRPPFVESATREQIDEAALQFVRKVSGFRRPSRANAAAFDEAVSAVAAATEQLLQNLATPAGTRRGERPA